MNYALIENDIVTNLIWLHPMNAEEFPNAVSIENLPVAIGDTYEDGKFYRDGVEVTVEVHENQSEQDFVDKLIAEVNA